MQVSVTHWYTKAQEIKEKFQVCTSQWLIYTVKWINKASEYFQNGYVASLALIGWTFVSFKLALLVSKLFNRLMRFSYSSYQTLPENERNLHVVALTGVFGMTLGYLNLMFCKIFQLPLTNLQIGGLTVPACLMYLYCVSRK